MQDMKWKKWGILAEHAQASAVRRRYMAGKIETACKVLGTLFLLYYLLIIGYAGVRANFAWFWAVGGICFWLTAGLARFAVHNPQSAAVWLVKGIAAVIAAGILVVILIAGRIIIEMRTVPEPNLEYVIVLGAQVRGTVPSKALRKRLVCALEYAKDNPDTILFLSGGQGDGEEISEAEAMRQFLTDAGLEEKRLILEDRSVSTQENLEFCNEIKEIKDCRVGIISNNFHIYRAKCLAKRLGYQNISGISAPSDAILQPHYIVREVFALAAAKLRGAI